MTRPPCRRSPSRIFLALLALSLPSLVARVALAEYSVEAVAVSGANSERVKTLVANRLTTGPAFDYAFVMVGTNDALNSSGGGLPLVRFEANLRQMLQQLIDAGVTPILAEVLPVIEDCVRQRHPWPLPNRRVAAYNVAVHRAAEATTPTTRVAPTHKRFLTHVHNGADSWVRNEANSRKCDGVHPTTRGYLEIALEYRHYVPARERRDKRIVLFGDSITASLAAPVGRKIHEYLQGLLNESAAGDGGLDP